jgi:hypothetical protein
VQILADKNNTTCNVVDFYKNPDKYICAVRMVELTKYFSKIESSFNLHNYWKIFYLIGKYCDVSSICELGILNGYSLLAMGMGTQDRKDKKNIHIYGYDLFDDYPYKSSSRMDVELLIQKAALTNVELFQKSVMDTNYNVTIPKTADIYIVDLSNCGDVVASTLLQINWKKTKMVVFEGGSKSRDNVDWMEKFKRKHMNPIFNHIKESFNVVIFDDYPSLTIVTKKLMLES